MQRKSIVLNFSCISLSWRWPHRYTSSLHCKRAWKNNKHKNNSRQFLYLKEYISNIPMQIHQQQHNIYSSTKVPFVRNFKLCIFQKMFLFVHIIITITINTFQLILMNYLQITKWWKTTRVLKVLCMKIYLFEWTRTK